MLTISITISGRVQGVFFRQSTREVATRLGITGEVRNLSNGDVHIIASGKKPQLDELSEWCKTGPEKAIVKKVDIKELPFQSFGQFKVVRS